VTAPGWPPPAEPDPSRYVPLPPFVRPPEHATGPLPGPPGSYPHPYAIQPIYQAQPTPAPPTLLALGTPGIMIALIGFVLIVASLLGLDWYTFSGGLTNSDVSDQLARFGDYANQLSVAYHSWLAWLLLMITTGCTVLACQPLRGLSLAFRIVGPIISGIAVLLTFGTFELTDPAYSTELDTSRYLDHLGPGFWAALIGFALVGSGSILGPRKLVQQPPFTS
jgi:hypothetical protein